MHFYFPVRAIAVLLSQRDNKRKSTLKGNEEGIGTTYIPIISISDNKPKRVP
jgi:hypothetical protein